MFCFAFLSPRKQLWFKACADSREGWACNLLHSLLGVIAYGAEERWLQVDVLSLLLCCADMWDFSRFFHPAVSMSSYLLS